MNGTNTNRFARRSLHTALAFAAMISVFGLGPPASAAPEPARPQGTPAGASLGDDEAAIAYVISVDGVARGEAKRRLAAQQSQFETAHRLAARLGDRRTGGAWIDRGTGELVVDVLDEGAADEVRAAGARPRAVTYSTARLDAAVDRISAAAVTGEAEAAQSWHIDVKANAVVVELDGDASPGTRAATLEVIGALGPVARIREGSGPLMAVQNVHPGFSDTNTGGERCTAGLSARDPLFPGGEVMITAAHCVMNPFGPLTTINSQFLGSAYKTRPDHDVAAVFNASGGNLQLGPHVWAWFSGFKTMIGTVTVVPFGVICKSGNFTGYTCGQVLGVNQNGKTKINNVVTNVTGLTATNLCVKSGDSGGPVIIDAPIPGTGLAAGTTQSSRLYDAAGNLWSSPSQGAQFCGNEFNPPKMTLSAYAPVEQTLADLGLTIMTG